MRYVLIAGVVVLLAVIGGGSALGSGKAALPVLNIGASSDPYTSGEMNPANLGALTPIFATSLSYEPLIRIQPNGKLVPGLAVSWRYVPEPAKSGLKNKVFEFTLRKGAHYSDGELVDAVAVKAWLDYFVKTTPTYSTYLGKNPTFTATGPYTVQIKTTTPNPQIPKVISQTFPWGYPAALEGINNPAQMSTQTFGAGPYMVDPSQSVAADHYVLIPNPHYFNKAAVKYSQINIKVIPDTNSMLQAMEAGQIDFAQGDPSTADAAAGAGLTVAAVPSTTATYVIADQKGQTVKALADVRVRQALNYALDRNAIAKSLFGNYGKGSSEIVSPDASEAKYENYYSYDVAKAKSLLAAAGYPNGFDLTLCTINLAIAAYAPLAQAVAKYWDAIGVNTTVNATPITGYGPALQSPGCPLFLTVPQLRSAQFQYSGYLGGAGLIEQAYHQNDPTSNQLYYAGLRAADPSVAWKQMYARSVTEGLTLSVVFYDTIYVYNPKKVKNVQINVPRYAIAYPAEFSPV